MDEINFESELDILLEQDVPKQNASELDIPPLDTPAQDTVVNTARASVETLQSRAEARKKAPRKAAPSADKPVAAGKFASAPARPERRPRLSKQDAFKQNTLPLIILAIAALLIVIFIIGSITRAVQKNKIEKEASIAASESIAAEQARLEAEMNSVLENAERMAAGYDFDGAIAEIDSFSGNIGGYPKLQDARARFEYSKEAMVPWEDPNTIINLSFQILIPDPERAFAHEKYGNNVKNNFITVSEFQKILERLYENDYILVSPTDIVETATTDSGSSYFQYKELMLPEGKKPVVLTQTNVNYNYYLVDSDEDKIADKDGVGIASKLVLENGEITCEMVNADGTTSTGAYDLIPILDEFVEAHPDFSYHGAKAVLALTGYNGLFGYRTDPDARAVFGEEQYEKDVASIQAIAAKLRETGYDLACYTYGNISYGKHSLSQIQSDMNQWIDEVVPILGDLDIMVFAQNSDLNSGVLYSGDKFEYLKSLGYKYFLGFCAEGDPFTFIAEDYVRQGRLLVTGNNLWKNDKWFAGIFDTEGLLDSARG